MPSIIANTTAYEANVNYDKFAHEANVNYKIPLVEGKSRMQ